ncbi:MAG: tyrosine--tRNA ligase [Verrucomicrobiota bacterium]|jgi:tyrosyl-tRNA synthetase|nr:tyrosine--tRNA ligase [Verrucomicrobiota bacterium]
MTLEQQLEKLTARTVDLHRVEELKNKLAKAAAEKRPLRIKLGADPSAPDLHLGHCVVLNKLREFQECGHTVVFIIGDFTGMIGDPSGKSVTRPQLSKEQVLENAGSYREQVFKLLDPAKTEIRFNSEWFGPMTFDKVIRLSANVTVAQLLARDDFAKRYGANQPISLVEFLYPLVQAYDSVMVNADVEVGGTDQLFNLLLGREIQKVHGLEPQIALTMPLLEGLDGVNKMSKSLGNYIAVNDTPRDIFGKAMSVSDELMWRYFSLVLCLPEDEIQAMREAVASGARHPRDVKDELGRRLVEMFYDADAAAGASEEFARVFSKNQLPTDIPEVELPAGKIGLLTLMVKVGLASGTSEARRLIQAGAVKLDEQRQTDIRREVELRDGMILRSGKRGFARLVLEKE